MTSAVTLMLAPVSAAGHFDGKAMPSAGTIPFLQSYFCTRNNTCHASPVRSEMPGVIENFNASVSVNHGCLFFYSCCTLHFVISEVYFCRCTLHTHVFVHSEVSRIVYLADIQDSIYMYM